MSNRLRKTAGQVTAAETKYEAPTEIFQIRADLSEKMDFSTCESLAEVCSQFRDLAEILLTKISIDLNSTKFRVIDIELGLVNATFACDSIHCREIQSKAGHIYVHKSDKAGTLFRSGKIKGFDITCGKSTDSEDRCFGTLLVKGIQILNEGDYSGPSLALGRLVRGKKNANDYSKWNESELRILESIDGINIFSNGVIEGLGENPHLKIEFIKRESIQSDASSSGLPLRAKSVESNAKSFKEKSQKSINKELEQTAKVIPIRSVPANIAVESVGSLIQSTTIDLSNFFATILHDRNFDLKLGGKLINCATLRLLKSPEELKVLRSKPGCYFIFSDLPKNRVPAFSEDGHASFYSPIFKDGKAFHLLYNGKSDDLGHRLKTHLFNSHTKEKVLHGIKTGNKPKRLSGSGAMSLEFLTNSEVKFFESNGAFDQKEMRLKPFQKSISHQDNKDTDLPSDGAYFLNGIDLREPQWKGVTFGVVVLETDHPIGPVFLEEAFVTKNFRPPLCRRFG